jgi:nucleotide-binding universal stress UspA family protein
MFQNVLVGYDGSKSSKAALECAALMARKYEADVTALCVCKRLPRLSDLLSEFKAEREAADEYYKARCTEIFRVAKQHGVDIRCKTLRGHPANTILRFADAGDYDLIVVGYSDHSELWGRLLGNIPCRIADHAHCDVLIVRKSNSRSE